MSKRLAELPYLPPRYRHLVDSWLGQPGAQSYTLALLLSSSSNNLSCSEILELTEKMRLIHLPKVWWTLQLVLNYETPEPQLSIPPSYLDTWNQCLPQNVNVPTDIVSTAVAVYELYRNISSDPVVDWTSLTTHFETCLDSIMESYRQRQFWCFYYTGIEEPGNVILDYQKVRQEQLREQQVKIADLLLPRSEEFQAILAGISRLPTAEDLKGMLTDERPEMQRHLATMLEQWVQFLLQQCEEFPLYFDIIQPLLEAMGMLRHVLVQQTQTPPEWPIYCQPEGKSELEY